MSHFGDVFHITFKYLLEMKYPQYLGDVQLGHLPTPETSLSMSKMPETKSNTLQ